MKRLLFITKKYPFGSGEEFIETEISYLAKQFDEIIIFAVSAEKGNNARRITPKNVIAVPLYETKNKTRRYAFTVLKGMLSLNDKELRAELKRSPGAKGKLAALYAHARVKGNLKKINAWFNRNPEKKDIGTLYSYWFLDTAVLACKLKQSLFDTARAYSRAHGYDLYAGRNISGSTPFREYSLRVLDGVFPCSRDGAQYLERAYPQYSGKVRCSYLGTSDNGVCTGNADKSVFHIATCSAITPLKRVSIVADAVKELESLTDRKIIWTCIGDGQLLASLKEQCASFTSAEVYFKGYVPNSDVLDMYKNEFIDCFINVSENEGLPVSIMEVQSFGTPVIATAVGGTGEIVIDGETGFLLPPDVTGKELSEKLLSMCNLPDDEYMSFRENSRARWCERFDAEKNYSEFSRCIGD